MGTDRGTGPPLTAAWKRGRWDGERDNNSGPCLFPALELLGRPASSSHWQSGPVDTAPKAHSMGKEGMKGAHGHYPASLGVLPLFYK